MIRMICFVFCLFLFLSISGCGATTSGIVKVGLDTYSINVTSGSSPSDAKKEAYSDAEEECEDDDKEMLVVQEKQTKDDGDYTIDLVFRCLKKDDPEMQKRPAYQKEAETSPEKK